MSFGARLHLNTRKGDRNQEGEMGDYTVKRVEEMEPIYDGIVRRARASLGVSAFGMQVMDLPPGWEGYPNHDHVHDFFDDSDLRQEEVYVALGGSATLSLDGSSYELVPGMVARVGPGQKRRLLPGPDGFRMVAVGGRPGEAYRPPAWTELGGPLPTG
jgi:mannose-6-phosphate isomerase-like protein (cupin superfamily)